MVPSRPLIKGKNFLDHVVEEILADDFQRFYEELDEALQPQQEYLTDLELNMYKKGKKIRPVIMFLAARLHSLDRQLEQKSIKGAVSLEMLHTATLVHDDIVDDALTRRGMPSITAHRGTKTALLVGDLQFVQALRSFVDAVETDNDMPLVKMVLDTAFDICCGELDEMKIYDTATTEERLKGYYRTIHRKTAVLFGLACEAGLALAGAHTHEARRGGFFGRSFGRAFQIMDDILDIIQSSQEAGKQLGIDFSQKRWTLPIIYAVDVLPSEHLICKWMLGNHTLTPREAQKCLSDLNSGPWIDKAYAEARGSALEALSYLEIFNPSLYRDILEQLTLFIIDRPYKINTPNLLEKNYGK